MFDPLVLLIAAMGGFCLGAAVRGGWDSNYAADLERHVDAQARRIEKLEQQRRTWNGYDVLDQSPAIDRFA